MKIIVCVKQVPGTTEVEVDPVTGVLKRSGVEGKLNPYDLFALETALRLGEGSGACVQTLTMGPPQARETLLETLYMGAHSAYLLTDRRFAGSDVAATSYALACAARKMGEYGLILCGKQTTDGDTAQVGPELAEQLGIEHAANVTRILELEEGFVTVTLSLDDRLQTQRMRLPCLLTIDKDVNTPRLPSYKRKRAVDENRVTVWSAQDVGAREERCGLKGSPTKVERIFPPEKNAEKRTLTGDAGELADALGRILADGKFI